MSVLLELTAANIETYLDQIVAIEQEAFAEPWTRTDYLEDAERTIAHLLALVDEAQPERLLAYAGFWRVLDVADINNVAVLASCRGQGLGSVLMAGLLDLARLLGCCGWFWMLGPAMWRRLPYTPKWALRPAAAGPVIIRITGRTLW